MSDDTATCPACGKDSPLMFRCTFLDDGRIDLVFFCNCPCGVMTDLTKQMEKQYRENGNPCSAMASLR